MYTFGYVRNVKRWHKLSEFDQKKTKAYSIDTKSKRNTGGGSVVVDLLFNVFSII